MRSANDNVQDSTVCTKEIVLPFSKKRISKKNNHIQTVCLMPTCKEYTITFNFSVFSPYG